MTPPHRCTRCGGVQTGDTQPRSKEFPWITTVQLRNLALTQDRRNRGRRGDPPRVMCSSASLSDCPSPCSCGMRSAVTDGSRNIGRLTCFALPGADPRAYGRPGTSVQIQERCLFSLRRIGDRTTSADTCDTVSIRRWGDSRPWCLLVYPVGLVSKSGQAQCQSQSYSSNGDVRVAGNSPHIAWVAREYCDLCGGCQLHRGTKMSIRD